MMCFVHRGTCNREVTFSEEWQQRIYFTFILTDYTPVSQSMLNMTAFRMNTDPVSYLG